jgi:hypothetical protein
VARASAHQVLPAVADAIAVAAGLDRREMPSVNDPCELWAIDAVADLSTPTYSRLFVWDGGDAFDLQQRIAVQCFTSGPDYVLALEQAAAIHDSLLSTGAGADDLPRVDWLVGPDGGRFVVNIHELSQPKQIGRDDAGRAEVSFDFEFSFIQQT